MLENAKWKEREKNRFYWSKEQLPKTGTERIIFSYALSFIRLCVLLFIYYYYYALFCIFIVYDFYSALKEFD